MYQLFHYWTGCPMAMAKGLIAMWRAGSLLILRPKGRRQVATFLITSMRPWITKNRTLKREGQAGRVGSTYAQSAKGGRDDGIGIDPFTHTGTGEVARRKRTRPEEIETILNCGVWHTMLPGWKECRLLRHYKRDRQHLMSWMVLPLIYSNRGIHRAEKGYLKPHTLVIASVRNWKNSRMRLAFPGWKYHLTS